MTCAEFLWCGWELALIIVGSMLLVVFVIPGIVMCVRERRRNRNA